MISTLWKTCAICAIFTVLTSLRASVATRITAEEGWPRSDLSGVPSLLHDVGSGTPAWQMRASSSSPPPPPP